jgi:hypothetical protein
VPDRPHMRASGGYGSLGARRAAARKFAMSCSYANSCTACGRDPVMARPSQLPPPRLLSTVRTAADSMRPLPRSVIKLAEQTPASCPAPDYTEPVSDGK